MGGVGCLYLRLDCRNNTQDIGMQCLECFSGLDVMRPALPGSVSRSLGLLGTCLLLQASLQQECIHEQIALGRHFLTMISRMVLTCECSKFDVCGG